MNERLNEQSQLRAQKDNHEHTSIGKQEDESMDMDMMIEERTEKGCTYRTLGT